jgi:hypothetical protein
MNKVGMNIRSKSGLLGAACAGVMVATSVLFQGVSQAAIVPGDTNATWTTYDAVSGTIDFSWDTNSQYDIVDSEVILKTDDIVLGDTVAGTLYEFVIPNFFDPLPKKNIEVEMRGANAGASGLELARVLDIVGADSDFFNRGPAVPVDADFVSGTLISTLVTELWEMFPNPDFEIVKIFSPAAFELESVMIHTQSVPIPAAVWLFFSGLLAMVGIARRRAA